MNYRENWTAVGPSTDQTAAPKTKKGPVSRALPRRVSDGTRTRDRLDHNQELLPVVLTESVFGGLCSEVPCSALAERGDGWGHLRG